LTGIADDIEDADPGLAQERTELAWHRTAISFAAVGAAMLKYHVTAGLLVLAVGGAVWRLSRLVRDRGTARASGRRLVVITVTIAGVSVTALAITLLGHGAGGLRP